MTTQQFRARLSKINNLGIASIDLLEQLTESTGETINDDMRFVYGLAGLSRFGKGRREVEYKGTHFNLATLNRCQSAIMRTVAAGSTVTDYLKDLYWKVYGVECPPATDETAVVVSAVITQESWQQMLQHMTEQVFPGAIVNIQFPESQE